MGSLTFMGHLSRLRRVAIIGGSTPNRSRQAAAPCENTMFTRLFQPKFALIAAAAFATIGAAPGRGSVADAVKTRDIAVARALLAQGADVNAPQGDGATALHWAAHWDDLDTAELLIRAGASANAANDIGVTPLMLACANGSAPMTQKLLAAGANPNLARATGVTPLMTAARTGNLSVVRALVAAGADVNAQERTHSQTALMWAAGENHVDVVRLLLDHGARTSARTPARVNRSVRATRECCASNYVGGFTPLLFAAQQGHLETARLLLSRGADINETDGEGNSALLQAIEGAPVVSERVSRTALVAHPVQEAMAKFLVENGADLNLAGSGRTALHAAIQRKMPGLVKTLLAHGADPNARLTKPLPPLSRFVSQMNALDVTTVGATPFWLAASFGDTETMRRLVAHGADPSLKAADNTTALMVAAGVDFADGQDKYGIRTFSEDISDLHERARDAVKLCLELGLDINAVNNKGQTAIFGGVYMGGTLLVQFLVDQGARIDVRNKRGQTPWLVAAVGEYRAGSYFVKKETGALLEKLGADKTLGVDLGPAAVSSLPQRD
jgi:ankyrin repeat protein